MARLATSLVLAALAQYATAVLGDTRCNYQVELRSMSLSTEDSEVTVSLFMEGGDEHSYALMIGSTFDSYNAEFGQSIVTMFEP